MSTNFEVSALVNQFMVAQDFIEEPVTHIVELIDSNKLSLLDFIKALGKYLTDQSDPLRSRSLALLSAVLTRVSSQKLLGTDIGVLVNFFCAKLDDSGCTKQVLEGIQGLVKMDGFTKANADVVLSGFIDKYSTAGQMAATRYLGFCVLHDLLRRFKEYLVAVRADEFIKAFLKVTTNEKDPKNLMESFKLNKEICENFEIGAHSEELFDCIFCYFPISFRAPENNPYDVTGDQLKIALRECLASNSAFAKDCFPNLVEKMATTSPSVKIDVLQCINACVENYDSHTVEEYWISLWNSLKFEVMHRELASADTLEAMFKYYENAENDDEKSVAETLRVFETFAHKECDPDYLILIYDSVKEYLGDPEGKRNRQGSVIMGVISSASVRSYNVVAEKTLQRQFSVMTDDVTVRQQRTLIQDVSFMLDAYYKLFNEEAQPLDLDHNALFAFKDDFLMLVSRALVATSKVEVTLRCLAIKFAARLFDLKDFLSTEEQELIVHTLTDVLLEDDNDNTFKQTLDALTSISRTFPMVVLEYTIPKIMVELDSGSHLSREKIMSVLYVVSSDNKVVVSNLVVRLLNKVETAVQDGDKPYSKLLLFSLARILQKLPATDSTQDYLAKFVPRFLYLVIGNVAFDEESCIHGDDIAAEYSARIMKEIVVRANHEKLFADVRQLFLEGETNNDAVIKPLVRPIDLSHDSSLLVVFSGICSAVNRSLKVDDPETLVSSLTSLLDTPLSLGQRQAVLQCVSVVVNKWYTNSQADPFLKDLANSVESSPDFVGFLETYTWISKALLMKNEPSALGHVDFLVGLLSSQKFSAVIPHCFEILVSDVDAYKPYGKPGAFGKLVVANVNVRPFYRQKLVDYVLPKLVAQFRANTASSRQYLMTISLLMKHTSKETVVPHLKDIMPVLITALNEKKSATIVSSALSIMEVAIQETPDLVKMQLSTLVPRLLEILQDQGASRGKTVKTKSLQCLIEVSRFPLPLIVPYKQSILHGCEPALDDDKREVRRLATDCREVYFELA